MLDTPVSPQDTPRDGAAVPFPPPVIPLLTVLLGVGLRWLWPIDVGFEISVPLRYWLGGGMVIGAVLGLGFWAVVLFRRSGQSELPWKPTPTIIDYGPYQFTRNPMYLQMVIACIGIAVMLSNVWILLLMPICMWLLHKVAIEPEEAYLERKFGEDYLAYKRRVRRWI